jgi:hypothetical protein
MRAAFEQELAAARRTFDSRVAALVSPDLAVSQSFIRGGSPDAREWEAAQRAVAHKRAAGQSEESARKRLAAMVQALRPGASRTLVLIDPDGINVLQVALDEFGSPVVLPSRQRVAWPDLVPMLSRDPGERRFQLVGGIAALDRLAMGDSLGRALPEVRDDSPLTMSWPTGWALVDLATRLISLRHPEATVIPLTSAASGQLTTMVESAIAATPLRRGYGLVVAAVDPRTGEVRTQTRSLFAAGDRPGARHTLSLRRPPGTSAGVALAVVVDRVDTPALSLSSVNPATPAFRLCAVLDGPGRVRITDPPGITPHPRTWQEVRAQIPRQVDTGLGPTDLICAIEMAGPQELTSRRRRLVRNLLEILAQEEPEQGWLRVAVVGCRDHVFGRRVEKRSVVSGGPLGSAAAALTSLAELTGSAVGYEDAAPLEDLLHAAVNLLAGSRAGGRAARVLLVASGRQPHPPGQGRDNIHPCPARYSWQACLRQLTGSIGASCAPVVDAIPKRRPGVTFWGEINRDHMHELKAISARRLGEDMRLLGRSSQRIPIPLAEME